MLKRRLQRTAARVFGSLVSFSATQFVINCLKEAKTRDWMASYLALRKAMATNDLSKPHPFDVVANMFGVWPLAVSYLKESGQRVDGDSLVVQSFVFGNVYRAHDNVLFVFRCSEEGDELFLDQIACKKLLLFQLLPKIC